MVFGKFTNYRHISLENNQPILNVVRPLGNTVPRSWFFAKNYQKLRIVKANGHRARVTNAASHIKPGHKWECVRLTIIGISGSWPSTALEKLGIICRIPSMPGVIRPTEWLVFPWTQGTLIRNSGGTSRLSSAKCWSGSFFISLSTGPTPGYFQACLLKSHWISLVHALYPSVGSGRGSSWHSPAPFVFSRPARY